MTLREHLEALRAADLRHEREDVVRGRERIAWIGVLGIFAWSEVQRRLTILNHANERVDAQQSNAVSKDTYEANETQRRKEAVELGNWRQRVDLDQSRSVSREEFERDSKIESRALFGGVTTGIRLILAAAAVVIALLGYQLARTHPSPAPTTTTLTVTTR